MLHDIHIRALRCATQILGGEEELRLYLQASEGDFSTWMGQTELPKPVFLRLVDIITGEEPAKGARRR